MLPGTPQDFLDRCRSFAARKARDAALEAAGRTWPDPYALAAEWGIEQTCWTRGWGTLSGGESQRVALAIAIGLGGAEVILLDGALLRWQDGADARTYVGARRGDDQAS